ncbi:hypothetical protein QE152_g15226 [Popillia japonica]|uniref:Uncharacterized protein n=1 Tax=Popillia japonica TaxID=7064 RepID=A0AAW1L8F2_POPJA
MIKLVHKYARDIGMELGNDKCVVYKLKRGRAPENEVPVKLINGRVIKHLCPLPGQAAYVPQDPNNMHKQLARNKR